MRAAGARSATPLSQRQCPHHSRVGGPPWGTWGGHGTPISFTREAHCDAVTCDAVALRDAVFFICGLCQVHHVVACARSRPRPQGCWPTTRWARLWTSPWGAPARSPSTGWHTFHGCTHKSPPKSMFPRDPAYIAWAWHGHGMAMALGRPRWATRHVRFCMAMRVEACSMAHTVWPRSMAHTVWPCSVRLRFTASVPRVDEETCAELEPLEMVEIGGEVCHTIPCHAMPCHAMLCNPISRHASVVGVDWRARGRVRGGWGWDMGPSI